MENDPNVEALLQELLAQERGSEAQTTLPGRIADAIVGAALLEPADFDKVAQYSLATARQTSQARVDGGSPLEIERAGLDFLINCSERCPGDRKLILIAIACYLAFSSALAELN